MRWTWHQFPGAGPAHISEGIVKTPLGGGPLTGWGTKQKQTSAPCEIISPVGIFCLIFTSQARGVITLTAAGAQPPVTHLHKKNRNNKHFPLPYACGLRSTLQEAIGLSKKAVDGSILPPSLLSITKTQTLLGLWKGYQDITVGSYLPLLMAGRKAATFAEPLARYHTRKGHSGASLTLHSE